MTSHVARPSRTSRTSRTAYHAHLDEGQARLPDAKAVGGSAGQVDDAVVVPERAAVIDPDAHRTALAVGPPHLDPRTEREPPVGGGHLGRVEAFPAGRTVTGKRGAVARGVSLLHFRPSCTRGTLHRAFSCDQT